MENLRMFIFELVNPFYQQNYLQFGWWFTFGAPLVLIATCILKWPRIKEM